MEQGAINLNPPIIINNKGNKIIFKIGNSELSIDNIYTSGDVGCIKNALDAAYNLGFSEGAAAIMNNK